MDVRTHQVLKVLDGTALELLAVLLEGPATEKALVEALPHMTQPTAHKKLSRLAESGIIRREPGDTTRGHPWIVVAPASTADALEAILTLADALDLVDQQRREGIRGRIGGSGGSTLRLVVEEES